MSCLCRYMKVALFLGFGSISSVVSISMGEITSPLQNVWFWLKHFRYKNKAADEIFAYVSWIYSAFYVFVRSFFGVAVVRPSTPLSPRYHLLYEHMVSNALPLICCSCTLLATDALSTLVIPRLNPKHHGGTAEPSFRCILHSPHSELPRLRSLLCLNHK